MLLQHKLQGGYRQLVSIVKRSSSGLRSRYKTEKLRGTAHLHGIPVVKFLCFVS